MMVKGQTGGDRRTQSRWTPKYELTSPTIAIEAVFFTLITVHSHEQQGMAPTSKLLTNSRHGRGATSTTTIGWNPDNPASKDRCQMMEEGQL